MFSRRSSNDVISIIDDLMASTKVYVAREVDVW